MDWTASLSPLWSQEIVLCKFPLVLMLSIKKKKKKKHKSCAREGTLHFTPFCSQQLTWVQLCTVVTPGPWAVIHWTPAGLTALTSCSHLQDNPVPGAAHTRNKSTTPPLHPHASTGCHIQPWCHLQLSLHCFWYFGPKSLYSVLTQRKNTGARFVCF